MSVLNKSWTPLLQKPGGTLSLSGLSCVKISKTQGIGPFLAIFFIVSRVFNYENSNLALLAVSRHSGRWSRLVIREDQWFIKSTLDKDLSDHWSVRSEGGTLDHWSNAFLWAKDMKLVIFPSGAKFPRLKGTSYIDRKDCWRSLHKFCDKHEIRSILLC